MRLLLNLNDLYFRVVRKVGKRCHDDDDDDGDTDDDNQSPGFSVASEIKIPWNSVRLLGIESSLFLRKKEKKTKISDLYS